MSMPQPFSLNPDPRVRRSGSTAGFSLLELLLVIGVLAILGSIGSAYYFNVVKNIEMSTAATGIISDLKHAQSSAMAGESGMRWGVHLVNGTDDYYQVFSTPTNFASASTTITSIVYLPQQIVFSDPSEGSTKDVVFERITGVVTSTTITLASSDSTRVITVPAIGSAY